MNGGKFPIKSSCAVALGQLNRVCKECCKGKGFIENCIKPLQNYVSQPTDPAFNDHYDDYLNNRDQSTGAWTRDHYNKIDGYWGRVYSHGFSY